MESEAQTRKKRIDTKLRDAGWKIVPFKDGMNLGALSNHAIEEFPTANGPADYALVSTGQLLGVIEAKKVTVGAKGVLVQAERYSKGVNDSPFNFDGYRVPLLYSTNGEIIYFHDVRHPLNTSRKLSHFHTPSALNEMFSPRPASGRGVGGEGLLNEWFAKNPNQHPKLREYSQGVKANVIFFQKGMPTEDVWIFDARSNVPGITKKDRPLSKEHFAEFEKCYGKDPNGLSRRKDLGEEGRFRNFHLTEIQERDYKLDITWLKDESLESSDDLPDPQDLATEAITELDAFVGDLREIVALIEKEEGVEA